MRVVPKPELEAAEHAAKAAVGEVERGLHTRSLARPRRRRLRVGSGQAALARPPADGGTCGRTFRNACARSAEGTGTLLIIALPLQRAAVRKRIWHLDISGVKESVDGATSPASDSLASGVPLSPRAGEALPQVGDWPVQGHPLDESTMLWSLEHILIGAVEGSCTILLQILAELPQEPSWACEGLRQSGPM